jgi:hypothetical protein
MDRKCSGVNERKIRFGGLPGKVSFELVFVQGDPKVSVHLMITKKKSGAQRLFDHTVYLSTVSNISLIIERSGVELVKLRDGRVYCLPFGNTILKLRRA